MKFYLKTIHLSKKTSILSTLFDRTKQLAPLRFFAPLAAGLGIFICFGLVLKPEIFITLHQFLFAKVFIGLAFSAFLLTAMPVWCEFKHSLNAFKFTLFSVLSAALLCGLLGAFGGAFSSGLFSAFNATLSEISSKSSSVFISLFWLVLFLQSLYLVLLGKNSKNFSLLFVLFVLFVLELLQGLSALEILEISALSSTHLQQAFLLTLISAVLLISFRINIVLCNEALQKSRTERLFIGDFISKNLSLFTLFVLILALLFQPFLGFKNEVLAFLCFALSAFFISSLRQWLEGGLLRQNYVVIFFCFWLVLIFTFVTLGLEFMGVFADFGGLESAIFHLLNITLLLGFTLFVFCIASLRHSTLQGFGFDFRLCALLACVFVAGLLRFLLAPSTSALLNLDFIGLESALPVPLFILLPSFFLALAFVLWLFYFIRFYQIYAFRRE